MVNFIYTAWLRDNNANVKDEDYEYPVCLIIKAKKDLLAKEWGDEVIKKYVSRNLKLNLDFIKSEISRDCNDADLNRLPLINYGYNPTDDQIGL